jgi:hypothetical protein
VGDVKGLGSTSLKRHELAGEGDVAGLDFMGSS